METMHAAGRRTLPPVPRAGGERGPSRPDAPSAEDTASPGDVATQRFVVDFSTGEQRVVRGSRNVLPAQREAPPDGDGGERRSGGDRDPQDTLDAAQLFVERLRSAAPEFAEAAGALSAVVREAVPPARHRRSRCRVVLRYADRAEADVTFLGPAGAPGTPSRHGFDRQIRRWLGGGQHRDAAWLVPDEDASDGQAVDVSAWLTAG